ncbi:spore coat protein [Candidatus Peregrinibacteria bacterium RIFCSPLOWO2_02_FULL_48_14]|nr:MAG: spore coat protein [Candidatus Peregrinibacteria bacterium RIFCSPLOWO2_02_FULL_48_14]
MKGVILAGGTGSRLAPLTKVTNKHLLPIYDRPMIFYPLLKLKEMGITSVLLVSGRGHAGHFLELLGGGSEFGVSISYEVQEEAGGIAQALGLARDFVGNQKFVVMLGDNVYEDNLAEAVQRFESGDSEAHIFLKAMAHPESYGVPRFEGEKIVEILEKPKVPPSPYAVTGCYMYSPDVFEVIQGVEPSARGELEISSVNDHYVKKNTLTHTLLEGFWGDCGESIDGMMQVARFIQENTKK